MCVSVRWRGCYPDDRWWWWRRWRMMLAINGSVGVVVGGCNRRRCRETRGARREYETVYEKRFSGTARRRNRRFHIIRDTTKKVPALSPPHANTHGDKGRGASVYNPDRGGITRDGACGRVSVVGDAPLIRDVRNDDDGWTDTRPQRWRRTADNSRLPSSPRRRPIVTRESGRITNDDR